MINVTKTFLPPVEEYNSILKRAWDSSWITNRGQLVLELEEKLKAFLKVKNILITNNGTIPLQIALKLLGKRGDIITTPFSYVATSASIVWENCKPIFVDIDPEHFTIDETKIEQAITDNTTAILATHVFGNPCNVTAIDLIARKYNLKVIYDAAHCFGVEFNGSSIFNYGDISTCSFHATKVFHCGEGGAIFANNNDLFHEAFYSHNFGHNGALEFYGLGINGKISELQAAMGLAVAPYIDKIFLDRKLLTEQYKFLLNSFQTIKLREGTKWNYSYYPILFDSEEMLLATEARLNQQGIYPRRYFYPSLNTVGYLKSQSMPRSESIAKRIMCLPLYSGLKESDLDLICSIVKGQSERS
jgi:dTDP-4-amino-4,6-dideoxygalactose transaminase